MVAAASAAHDQHRDAKQVLMESDPTSLCTAMHAMTELYSVLSGSLKPRRLSPKIVVPLIEQYAKKITVFTLTFDETLHVIKDCATRGITGAAIYDTLILACARKAGATVIYTYNLRDFRRIAPDLISIIRTP